MTFGVCPLGWVAWDGSFEVWDLSKLWFRIRRFKNRRQEFWSGFRNFGSGFEDLAWDVKKSGQATRFFAKDFAIKTNITVQPKMLLPAVGIA